LGWAVGAGAEQVGGAISAHRDSGCRAARLRRPEKLVLGWLGLDGLEQPRQGSGQSVRWPASDSAVRQGGRSRSTRIPRAIEGVIHWLSRDRRRAAAGRASGPGRRDAQLGGSARCKRSVHGRPGCGSSPGWFVSRMRSDGLAAGIAEQQRWQVVCRPTRSRAVANCFRNPPALAARTSSRQPGQ